jgi:Tfp pilus assembly protein PilF
MKKYFASIVTLISLFILYACSLKKGNDKIVTAADYKKYLRTSSNSLNKIDAEIQFWQNRFIKTPDDIIARSKIAGLLCQRFQYSGNIREIHEADSLYQLVNHLNRSNNSSTFRSLAANCITQHKFLQAQLYIDSALQLGDDKYLSTLMEFDVAMELGNKIRARRALNTISQKNSFEYYIREAKYKDHAEGKLDEAILLMEKAWNEVKNGNNPATWLWAKSNLADMYSHANRFKEAYQAYLEVLDKDPEYYHALKGIAWLAFSKDKNTGAAKEILSFLKQQHPVPDYDLLLAEIAAYENNEAEKKRLQEEFITRVQHAMYGDMYNKYLFTLKSDELKDANAALDIASKEVRNRPTGEAFSWLAWAYLQNGRKEEALKTARVYVENNCFEPDAVFLLGKIYLATGDRKKAGRFLQEAYESRYELGPSASEEIEQALKQL